jgi:homoserine kinase type II
MAVYTDVSDEQICEFIAEYDLGNVLSFKGIAEGVSNSNFLVVTDTAPFILTLFEARVDAQDLPFFIGLMQHLAQKGLVCPQPLAGRDGQILRHLNDRPAIIVSFLKGLWPKKPLPIHCGAVGSAMAHLHLAGQDFAIKRPNALSLAGWHDLAALCQDRGDEIMDGLSQEIMAELAFLDQYWPDDLPVGVIHADLFPDNVFFQRESLTGLIDFYFACNDMLAYELAICLNAWCFEPDGALNITKSQQMIAHYQKIRPLSATEIAALPILARGAALRFLLTRLYDWLNVPPGALVQPKDPREYWQKLRFHRTVQTAKDYGISDVG